MIDSGGRTEAAAMVAQDPQRLEALCSLWQGAQRDVWITLQGESMVPTILPGARLCLRCQDQTPSVGEVIAFRRGRSLVVHRLMRLAVEHETGNMRLLCKGDGNREWDEPITAEMVVGVVVAAQPPGTTARAGLMLRRWLRRGRQSLRLTRRGRSQNSERQGR